MEVVGEYTRENKRNRDDMNDNEEFVFVEAIGDERGD